jgi:hypothetical protein
VFLDNFFINTRLVKALKSIHSRRHSSSFF